MKNIEFVENLKVITFKDDDVLVIRLKGVASPQELEDIKNYIAPNLPKTVKINLFIIDSTIDIGVLRKENK